MKTPEILVTAVVAVGGLVAYWVVAVRKGVHPTSDDLFTIALQCSGAAGGGAVIVKSIENSANDGSGVSVYAAMCGAIVMLLALSSLYQRFTAILSSTKQASAPDGVRVVTQDNGSDSSEQPVGVTGEEKKRRAG